MMRGWVKPALYALVIFAGAFVLWWQTYQSQNTMYLNGKSFHVTIARTQVEREKGLSATTSLSDKEAMVIVFPENSQSRIWMKDMKYPIDIVWLNDAKQVVYMVANAQPSSYPKTIYASPVPARYVIEFSAGTIAKLQLKKDTPVGLPSGV